MTVMYISVIYFSSSSDEVEPVHEDHDGPALRPGILLHRAHQQDGADHLQVPQLPGMLFTTDIFSPKICPRTCPKSC